MIEREEYLFGIEEKFLAATEMVDCCEFPAAKIILHEILEEDPCYARAHFDLARIYYYGLIDIAKAAYHIKLCYQLEPHFSPTYYLYLDILLMQRDFETAKLIAAQAMEVHGICHSCIINRNGLLAEAQQKLSEADNCYRAAILRALNDCCTSSFEKNIERVKKKQQMTRRFIYSK